MTCRQIFSSLSMPPCLWASSQANPRYAPPRTACLHCASTFPLGQLSGLFYLPYRSPVASGCYPGLTGALRVTQTLAPLLFVVCWLGWACAGCRLFVWGMGCGVGCWLGCTLASCCLLAGSGLVLRSKRRVGVGVGWAAGCGCTLAARLLPDGRVCLGDGVQLLVWVWDRGWGCPWLQSTASYVLAGLCALGYNALGAGAAVLPVVALLLTQFAFTLCL